MWSFATRYTVAMRRRSSTKGLLEVTFCTVLGLSALCPRAYGWGNEGHRMINRLAVLHLPADAPAFLRTAAALDEIEYLGPEPDRWRSPGEPELNAAQAPEHFIDLELADALGPLPHRRFDFEKLAYAHGDDPAKIGLQPWQATEVWERLKAAFREYRHLSAEHADTKPVEQAILFYAGWLGHYVGDGSQPLHTTIEYNGWVGPNPNGYTTSHKIHWQFEGVFVGANIHPSDVAPKMTPLHVLQGDIFDDYVAYLRESATHVEEVYKLEKAGGFEGEGSAASRDFAAERLAAGASMLRDMIEAAWVDSAIPVPDPYAK
ncbi:MAG TPA: S1/P1 nuclease [Terracidiphilus sp.]|nr:S1/P1 nuclease [Terracidiphilus sp.]